jgi:hypothetical protein
MDTETVEVVEEAGSNPPPPPGFYRTYLYCQHQYGGSHCRQVASVRLTPIGGRGMPYLVCFDHSNHRPPITGDYRWRAPSR